jgi:hypothetical protein
LKVENMNDTSKIVESAARIYADITTNKPAIGDMVIHNKSNPYVSKDLNDYEIATLVQLVTERNQLVIKMLASPSEYWVSDRVAKLTAIYSAELVENDALIAKLQAIAETSPSIFATGQRLEVK